MTSKPRNFTDVSRDAAILRFLWRWKVSTTSSIATRFYPNAIPLVAYNKLISLRSARLVEQQPVPLKPRTFLWALTKKGFESVRPYLSNLVEDGFRSECPEHDLLVAACQLGPSLVEGQGNVEMFSERELRSTSPDLFPEWVPQTSGRRPDGYWRVPYKDKMRIIALEVERNKKGDTKYEVIATSYKDNPSIFRVVWLVPSTGNAKAILDAFEKEVGENARKHDFILIKDFERVGWQAPIVLGLEQSRTLAFVLQHQCANTVPCLCRGIAMAHLNTNLRRNIFNTYRPLAKNQFSNCVGFPSIASPTHSNPILKPKEHTV